MRGELCWCGVKGVRQLSAFAACRVGDRHIECQRTLRNGLADAANTHDAHTGARHFARQRHRTAGPLAVFDVAVCGGQLAGGAEHQANR